MMEWYFGHEIGDLVVPKDQDFFDQIPSPDNWSQWGFSESENYGWPYNFDASKISNSPDQKSYGKMFSDKGKTEVSLSKQGTSYGSSVRGASSEDSMQRNSVPDDCPDLCFDDLMGTDQMDDLFFYSQFGVSSDSQAALMRDDSGSSNKMLELQSSDSDTNGIGSSEYMRMSAFSPLNCSDYAQTTTSGVGNLGQSDDLPVKASETMVMLPMDHSSARSAVGEGTSLEESMLCELETVLTQLNEKTRLCVRDSLYRLAHSSRQHTSVSSQVEGLPLDKPPPLGFGDGARQARAGASELGTNTVDRAVANLMFTKVDVNARDLLPSLSSKFEHCKNSSSPTLSRADSEVPIFTQQSVCPTEDRPLKM